MRRRTFAMKDSQAAVVFMIRLLAAGYEFTVKPCVDRVEVTTPFELAAQDFPDPEGLKP